MSVDYNSLCSGPADCHASTASPATEMEHWEIFIFTFLGILASSVPIIIIGVLVAKRNRAKADGDAREDLEKDDPPAGGTAVPESSRSCWMNSVEREARDGSRRIVVKKVRFDLQEKPPLCPSSAQTAGTVQSSGSVSSEL